MMTQTTTSPRKGGAVDVSQGSYYQGGACPETKIKAGCFWFPKKRWIGDFC